MDGRYRPQCPRSSQPGLCNRYMLFTRPCLTAKAVPFSPPWIPTPDHQIATRALLRAILREVSYLPDPPSRTYMKTHILSRFRTYHPPCPDLSQTRWTSIITTARKSLIQLRRANTGDRKCLDRVLAHTYARTGRRRHQILTELLTSHPSPSYPLSAPPLPGPILALLSSQRAVQPPETTRKNPRSLSGLRPDPAARTIWGKPLSARAQTRNVLRARAAALESVHVPLCEEEWGYLVSRATRAEAVDRVPAIRAAGEGAFLMTGLVRYADPKGKLEHGLRSRGLMRRIMIRRYAALLAQVPRLEGGVGTWKITWGGEVLDEARRKAAVERGGRT